uniref:Uncharacterized protein n=1 Tax=Candidatus Kentrum sp. LFY TaxID=2126342 RepID=A0A450WQG0_9GAMM|nr:MAG: hypothetical protein BECKLFY1418C_GA0070996_10568 [Candidatus Kentron sp. LFY]
MVRPIYTKQFAKDLERCQKRGKNLEKFKIIARSLLAGESLDPPSTETIASSVISLADGNVIWNRIGC